MVETLSSVQLYRLLSTGAGQLNRVAVGLYHGDVEKAAALAQAEKIARDLAAKLGIAV